MNTANICLFVRSMFLQDILSIDEQHSGAFLLLGAIYQENDTAKVSDMAKKIQNWIYRVFIQKFVYTYIGGQLPVQSGQVLERSHNGLSRLAEMCTE